MYPDTDSPPTRIVPERVAAIEASLKPRPWERLERYGGWGVPEETSHYLMRRGGADIVDAVVERTGADGRLAAITIGQRAKALRRAGIPVQRLGAEEWVQVFDLYTGGHVCREAIPVLASRMARDSVTAREAARAEGVEVLERDAWLVRAGELATAHEWAATIQDPERRLRHLAGQVLSELRGKAPAAEVVQILRQELEAGR